MKANLLRLIDELSGKINPPMWTIFAYYFYLALKEGKNYDEAKAIGQSRVDDVSKSIGTDPYVQDSNSDYSLIGTPLLPTFGRQAFISAHLVAKYACESEKIFPEKTEANRKHVFDFLKITKNLNVTQKAIAHKWDDSVKTPPAHLLAIVLENSDDELLYEKVLLGLKEAAVACWALKYTIKQARPSEMIMLYDNEKFIPEINTPTHPSCPSGHSTFSGVVAEICKDMKDVKDPFTGLVYADFKAIQEEASMSRVYGGIHFLKDCEIGTKLGTDIGKIIARM